MLESQYLAIFGLASLPLFGALAEHHFQNDKPTLATIALGGYGLLALQGGSITVVSGGTSTTHGAGSAQLLTLGLALVAGIALVAALLDESRLGSSASGSLAEGLSG